MFSDTGPFLSKEDGMIMETKMERPIKEARAIMNNDGDSTRASAIAEIVKRHGLDAQETLYLCRYFGVQFSDILA